MVFHEMEIYPGQCTYDLKLCYIPMRLLIVTCLVTVGVNLRSSPGPKGTSRETQKISTRLTILLCQGCDETVILVVFTFIIFSISEHKTSPSLF